MTTGLLAVIDMQRVFAEPGSPWATPRFAEAAAGVRRLLPAFAERVTFTRFVAPDEPVGAWRAYYARWSFALQPPDAPLWRLTDEFADRAPHVMDATTFGKWTPELATRVGPEGAWSWPVSAPTAVFCPRPSPPPTRGSRPWWCPTPAPGSTTTRTPRRWT